MPENDDFLDIDGAEDTLIPADDDSELDDFGFDVSDLDDYGCLLYTSPSPRD